MSDIRTLTCDTAEAVLAWAAHPGFGAAWDEPSALSEMSVGALMAHTVRAITTLSTYLTAQAPTAAATVVDAAGYVLTVLPDTAPDSDTNVGVRARAELEAGGGHLHVVDHGRTALAGVRAGLEEASADRLLAVKDGIAIALDEYLVTRVVELVVHADDLAASVPVAGRAHLPVPAEVVTVACLAEQARRRSSTAAMIHALARTERAASSPPRAL